MKNSERKKKAAAAGFEPATGFTLLKTGNQEVIRMNFVEVAKITDITSGQMKAIHVEGKEILITNYDGKYFVINGKCTHMGGELVKGVLEGKTVTCPRHGAQFDVTTGKCISGPKMGPLKLKAKDEVTYEVKIEGDSIKLKL